jgi:hypothetical protein
VVEPLQNTTLPAPDRAALAEFQRRAASLQRAVMGTQRMLTQAQESAQLLRRALDDTPTSDAPAMRVETAKLLDRLREIGISLNGDSEIARLNEPTPPSLSDRVERLVDGSWSSTSAPTGTQRRAYEIVSTSLTQAIADLKGALESLEALGKKAEAAGAPWTPGRLPDWKAE